MKKKKYTVSVTYEVWTDEDREIGETDNRGFEVEPQPASLEDVIDYARSYYIEPKGELESSSWWYSEAQQDYRTGEDTYYHLHVEDNSLEPSYMKLSLKDAKRIDMIIASGESFDEFRDSVIDKVFGRLEEEGLDPSAYEAKLEGIIEDMLG
jgi:hypothetical protein